MQEKLSLSLIQTNIHWEDIEANLAMLEEKIWQIEGKTDIIVLPETFSTGFSNQANALAELMNMKTFRWMKQQAAQTGALILGSFIAKDGENFFNRLLWMEPDGTNYHYDKRHLFSMSDEGKFYKPGSELLIKNWKGWNICPLICYDLRFPVWSRNRRLSNDKLSYDLLIYTANWPAPRIHVWETLLRARAMENLSYVAGVNRTGNDGNGIDYTGQSLVYDFKGFSQNQPSTQEEIIQVTLHAHDLLEFRSKFPAHLDADDFQLL